MNTRSASTHSIASGSLYTTSHLCWLIAITVVGILFRLYRAGDLSLAGNEDYVANATYGVISTWIPYLPSGAIYPRSLLFTYLTSLAVYLFGHGDFVFRIPATVFSILTIILGYLLAGRLFGFRVAIIAALLLAFSDWEILLGRTARMYGMLSFFLLLSTWLLDKAITEGGRLPKILSLLSIVMTCFLHKLAIVLLPFYFFYFLYRQPRGQAFYFMIISILVIIFAYGANQSIERKYYSQAIKIEKNMVAARSVDTTLEITDANPKKATVGLWEKLRSSTTVKILSEKHLGIFLQLLKHNPIILVTLLLGLAIGMGIYGIRYAVMPSSRLYAGAVFSIVLPLCFQQIVVALAIVLLYASFATRYEPEGYPRRSFTLLSVCGVLSVLWIVVGIVSFDSSPFVSIQNSLKALFGFPTSFLAIYLSHYPFLSLCAIGATVIATKRYFRDGQLDEIGFVTLLFVGTILILGLHPLALSRPFPRYVACLNPYFLIMAAFAIDAAIRSFPATDLEKARVTFRLGTAFLILLGFSLVFRETGYSAWYMVNTSHGENRPPAATAGMVPSFHPDHRYPGMHLARDADVNDIVIAMDALALNVYFPRIDYQLRIDGGRDAERWLRGHTLFSEQELNSVLTQHRDRKIWIVLAGDMVLRYDGDQKWDRIMHLITSRAGQPRFTGRDGLSNVYLIAAQTG